MQDGTAYKWRVAALCCCIGALNYADRAAIASVYPLVRADLSLTDVELAAVGSFFLFAYAFASPFAGILADRRSRRRIIIISLAGWSAMTLVTGLVTNTHELLLTRVLLGLFEAAYVPAAIGLIAEHHDSRTRATAIGLHSGSLSIGVIAGGAGLGYLGEHHGWRPGFFLLGGLGLLLAWATSLLLRRDEPDQRAGTTKAPVPVLANLQALAAIPSYLVILVAGMCIGISHWIFLNWLPLYFREVHHLSLAGAGFAGTIMVQGTGVAAGILGSVFSDRIAGNAPRRRMLIQGLCCLLAAPFLGVFFAPQPSLAFVNASIFAFSFVLAFGACNVTPLTCDLLPSRLRSTAVGLGNALNCLAGGIGVLLSGFLKSSLGLAGVFGGLTGVVLVAATVLFIGYRKFLQRDLERSAALGEV